MSMHTIMKSLLIVPILLLAGCASYSIYGGDLAQRQLRNQWSANYELCERLTVATLASQEIRDEWTKEAEKRDVDCDMYTATTRTAVDRDLPFIRWSTQLTAPSRLIHAR